MSSKPEEQDDPNSHLPDNDEQPAEQNTPDSNWLLNGRQKPRRQDVARQSPFERSYKMTPLDHLKARWNSTQILFIHVVFNFFDALIRWGGSAGTGAAVLEILRRSLGYPDIMYYLIRVDALVGAVGFITWLFINLIDDIGKYRD